MLKNILNVKGAQKLSKKEQVHVNGGGVTWGGVVSCNTDADCVAAGGPGCNAGCFTTRTGDSICRFETTTCFGDLGD